MLDVFVAPLCRCMHLSTKFVVHDVRFCFSVENLSRTGRNAAEQKDLLNGLFRENSSLKRHILIANSICEVFEMKDTECVCSVSVIEGHVLCEQGKDVCPSPNLCASSFNDATTLRRYLRHTLRAPVNSFWFPLHLSKRFPLGPAGAEWHQMGFD